MKGISIAAFLPPLLFANTASVALSKNKGMNPGTKNNGELKINNRAIATI